MSFQKRLSAREFVVLAEMHTPKGVDISRLVTNARRIKGRVDGIVVPGMDNGIMRLSALAGGVLIQRQGLEAIIHVYCRDRNRMALQGDLLAAHVLGIQNVIVAPSEEIAKSDHRDAKPCFDLDELQLVEAIGTLQRGKDLAGLELEGAPFMTTGCLLRPFVDDAELTRELELARQKIEAGASYVITPPIFDLEYFETVRERLAGLGVPIIASVFLLKSVSIARYLSINEPAAHVSEELIARIRRSPDRENEGVRLAGELVAALKGRVQGVLIQTVGWEHRLGAILDIAGI